MEAVKQISPSCVSTNQLCWRNFRCNSRKRSELERILGASLDVPHQTVHSFAPCESAHRALVFPSS